MEHLCHRQAEHPVAEKFEPLIGLYGASDGARMDEGAGQ